MLPPLSSTERDRMYFLLTRPGAPLDPIGWEMRAQLNAEKWDNWDKREREQEEDTCNS